MPYGAIPESQMTDDKLRQLLHDADAAAAQPRGTTADLASGIRQRISHRQRRTHLAAASVVLCSLLALLPLLKTDPLAPQFTKIPIDPVKAQTELSLIRLQARSDSAAIAQIVQHQ